jgi:6-pyruvoyltetrahydropterin/6-carboxytetrahydropterin synthase
MIRVTCRYRFSASHRLHSPALSAEENRETYGKCNNPFGHGHNYVLCVSAAGPVDSLSGRVLDPRTLDSLVERVVLRSLDHRDLNTQAPEFADGAMAPTSECLAIVVRQRLQSAWSEAFPAGVPVLAHVHLEETQRNKFDLPSREHLI